MNTDEAMRIFNENHCHTIIVEHKRSKVQYYLHSDVVRYSIKDFVYGYFVKDNPRRKTVHAWFSLTNVNFVRVN